MTLNIRLYPLLSLLILFTISTISAQDVSEMYVVEESAQIAPGYIVANQMQNRDANGQISGAIIVETDLQGLAFESGLGIVRSDNKPGQYILIISPGEKSLRVLSPNHVPLNIFFPEYGIRIKSGQAWKIQITGDKKSDDIPVNFLVQPEGATLMIDGEEMSELTNLLIEKGIHQIKLSKPGYAPIEKEIEVSEKQSLFRFSMSQVDLVGITFRSEPEGATLYLNGQEMGVTPLSLFQYPGVYSIRYERDGYISFEDTLSIPVDQSEIVHSVPLVKNVGRLQLVVSPSDAQIRLGNTMIQAGMNEVFPGEYLLSVSKSGYLSKEEKITVELDETLEKEINLLKSTSSLSWVKSPEEATISINKQPYRESTRAELAPGTYLIEITAPGHGSLSETLTIERGENIHKTWILVPETGGFRFLSTPNDATAELRKNGETIRKWSGLKRANKVPVGEYELVVTSDSYRSQRIPVEITKGVDIELNVQLEKLPPLELLNKKAGMEATFKAIIFPGWGMKDVSGGEQSGKWITLSSLAFLGVAIGAEVQSRKIYDDFQLESEFSRANELYSRANQYRQTAIGFAAIGAGIWVYNIVRVARIGAANTKLKRKLQEEQEFSVTISPRHNGLTLNVNF